MVWEFVISFVIARSMHFFLFDNVLWPTTQNPLLLVVRLLGAEAREAAGRVSEANRLPRALFNHQRVERDAGQKP